MCYTQSTIKVISGQQISTIVTKSAVLMILSDSVTENVIIPDKGRDDNRHD